MKQFTSYYLSLLALLVTGLLGGCTKDLRTGGEQPELQVGERQGISFALSTGVETYGTGPIPAKDYEKKIESLQTLLFVESGTFHSAVDVTPQTGADKTYTLPIAEAGSYKMIVVANHKLQETDLKGKSLDSVKKMIVSVEPGKPNNFVMASDVKDFTINPHRLTDLGTITLTRLAARIDIQTTLSKLKLTKVTVKNRKESSSLLASDDTKSIEGKVKEYKDGLYIFEESAKSSQASMGQIYTYENSQSAIKDDTESKGTTVEIEGEYGGKAIKPVIVPLPQVKRNFIYSIQLVMDDTELTPGDDQQGGKPDDPKEVKIKPTLEVLDWETGETIEMSDTEIHEVFPKGMINPLSFMSYSNIGKDKQWLSFHPYVPNDMMTRAEAMEKLGTPATIGSSQQVYHLPTMEDWASILPVGTPYMWDENSKTFTKAILDSGEDSPDWYLFLTGETISYPQYWENFHMASYEKMKEAPVNTVYRRTRVGDKVIYELSSVRVLWEPTEHQRNETETEEDNLLIERYTMMPSSMEIGDPQGPAITALRYAGGTDAEKPYKSAWLYAQEHVDGVPGLMIYCVNITPDMKVKAKEKDETTGEEKEIEREYRDAYDLTLDFWKEYKPKAVRRFLPMTHSQKVENKTDNLSPFFLSYSYLVDSRKSYTIPKVANEKQPRQSCISFFGAFYFGYYGVCNTGIAALPMYTCNSEDLPLNYKVTPPDNHLYSVRLFSSSPLVD